MQHDPQVLECRLTADVFEVEFQLASHVVDAAIVALVDLRPASNARPYALALFVAVDLLTQASENRGLLGSGADDVHFTAQHVDELRQLVEPVQPQDSTYPRHPRIVGCGPDL